MLTEPVGPIPEAPNQKFQLGYGDYLRFKDLVLERSGLHFPDKKRSDLEIGLLKAMAEFSSAAPGLKPTLSDYYDLLRDKDSPTGRAEMARLIKTLTVGETHFFRDEAQFNALVQHVLPAIITRKRAAAAAIGLNIQPQLRIWSAGCSSGEEPYSMAMLLKELLPDIDRWHILILATDINQDSLTRAREASYSNWSFREARARELRSRYFRDETNNSSRLSPTRYRLQDDIRQMVTFASLNLIEDDYPAIHNNTVSMDLIICRNVTIYFTEEITRQVTQRFYQALVDQGWLVVGHSEPSLLTYRAFQAHTFPDTLLYQKTGQLSPWPADWAWLDPQQANQPPAIARLAPLQNWSGNSPTPTPNGKPTDLAWPLTPGSKAGAPDGKPALPPLAAQPKPEVLLVKQTSISSANQDPYQQAQLLLEKGYIEQAIVALQRKLAASPNFTPAYTLLGRAYANLGQWAEAQQWCQQALKLDRLQTEAYYVLSQVYQHEDQIELAIDMLKKAIYLESDTPLLHFNLGLLYRKLGEMANARRFVQNAIKLLEKWPPEKIVPDTGGTTASHLLTNARRILANLN